MTEVCCAGIQKHPDKRTSLGTNMREPLVLVAERHNLPFPIFLYNIFPFRVPSLVQAEYYSDEQRIKLYVEAAMEKATIGGLLAYLMAVGIANVYIGPSHVLQRMIFDQANVSLFSFLVHAQNQRTWIYSLMHAMDPAGPLQLKVQFEINVGANLVWMYSTWVNVSGIMHPLDETPVVNMGAVELPGFLFQVASLMLVDTEDLMPLIAPIVWPIFGAVVALIYPTQPLRVAASAPTQSLLHFVKSDDTQRLPTYHEVVRSFANLRPPMAYTKIKEKSKWNTILYSSSEPERAALSPCPSNFTRLHGSIILCTRTPAQ